MNQTDVLIVGAGPTGLVLALWLTKLGVRVRIIDKTEAPGTRPVGPAPTIKTSVWFICYTPGEHRTVS